MSDTAREFFIAFNAMKTGTTKKYTLRKIHLKNTLLKTPHRQGVFDRSQHNEDWHS